MESTTRRENEEKKAYLKRYRAALIAEKQIAEEIEALRLNTMLPSARNGDGMPHGSGGERDLSDYMASLDKLTRKLYTQMDKRIAIRMEITQAIESMACEPEKVLLRYRYILGYRWEDIGKKMHYSESGVLKLHGQALKNFQIFKRVQ